MFFFNFNQLVSCSNASEDVIQARNNQDAENGAQKHAAGSRGSDGTVAYFARTGGYHQRNSTGHEGKGGH